MIKGKGKDVSCLLCINYEGTNAVKCGFKAAMKLLSQPALQDEIIDYNNSHNGTNEEVMPSHTPQSTQDQEAMCYSQAS